MKLEHYINDFSKIADKNIITKYNEKFKLYKENTGTEIATVFIKHRNGRKLREIALEIFNENGIGGKQTNSGLLLIIVTDEKKIRIMTGKGMELEFPESYCRNIIEKELRPLLNRGKYSEIIKSWYELSSKSRIIKKELLINKVFKLIYPIFSIFSILVSSMIIGLHKNNILIPFFLFIFIGIIYSFTKKLRIILIFSIIALFGLFIFNSEIPKIGMSKEKVIINNNNNFKETDGEWKKYDFDKYNNTEVEIIKNNELDNYINDSGYSEDDSYDWGDSSSSSSYSSSDWGGGSSNGGGYGD